MIAQVWPGFYSGSVAVCLFFAISGCLLVHSWMRAPKLWKFVSARIVRVYPAYFVCLLLTVFVLGPAFASGTSREFLEDPATREYLLHNIDLAGLLYTLPGVFAANHVPEVANGSLWSLALEVRLYLVLVVLAALRILWSRAALLLVVLVYAGTTMHGWLAEPTHAQENSALALLFMLFALVAAFSRHVPVSTRLLGVLGVSAWMLRDDPSMVFLTMTAIGYFALWFAWRMPVIPLRWSGDYSYGIFLYGFPVQQMLLAVEPALSPLWLSALALPVALVFAAFSWHVVEQPLLRLKQPPHPVLATSA